MFRPKRLYTFMVQSFLPVFFMTFFICLFIVLMQFLWKYVDEMVGKGLEMSVLFELFLYAALTMVPLSLPLSILLASLMTFGNLGEKLELLAIKAAGVSLLKVMRPTRTCLAGAYFGPFHPKRFWNTQSIPAIASGKNSSKSGTLEVADFKK